MPSQISYPCLQETSCSKYHFSSLCKGRRVGTCCQGFECSNGLYSQVPWDCSLWWWGHCPAFLSPLAPCSPFPCGVALILLLPDASEQGRSPRNYFHGMNGNFCGKKVLYSLPKFYLQIYLCLWPQFEVILSTDISIIPCSIWSLKNGGSGIPNLDAWERPELDNVSISVQQKKYQAGYLVVTTCSSTTAFNLPILSWLMTQSHSTKALFPATHAVVQSHVPAGAGKTRILLTATTNVPRLDT